MNKQIIKSIPTEYLDPWRKWCTITSMVSVESFDPLRMLLLLMLMRLREQVLLEQRENRKFLSLRVLENSKRTPHVGHWAAVGRIQQFWSRLVEDSSVAVSWRIRFMFIVGFFSKSWSGSKKILTSDIFSFDFLSLFSSTWDARTKTAGRAHQDQSEPQPLSLLLVFSSWDTLTVTGSKRDSKQ